MVLHELLCTSLSVDTVLRPNHSGLDVASLTCSKLFWRGHCLHPSDELLTKLLSEMVLHELLCTSLSVDTVLRPNHSGLDGQIYSIAQAL
ncbi:hypothetical protein GE061_006397 [Apolygus lucorum]|uniref:Uncharacterized protein n=1 Tax=Apolygus lucorum TaxID=248454 RepID=A0A8S9WWC9_APOLU|nr:hypothetical protein GE061_006397 [Apolygus lucorum]